MFVHTPPPERTPRRDVLTVSQLTGLARGLLEDAFPSPWIVGEVSNFRPAASGHWYFTLKDQGAELKVAMFRQRNMYARLRPEHGIKLRVRGRLTVYEARGELQLIAEQLEAAGLGDLQQQLELLKARLAAEGLFALERKRALPKMPRRLAVLSSPGGAAIHDVLSVLRRRYPLLQVELWPTLVQGSEAPAQITEALRGVAAAAQRYDLLLVTRGGGSLEDLWCFNDESVVRAIAAMPIPVLCAIGHETDFTLADLAADLRAPTPSAAAELLSPDQQALRSGLEALHRRLIRALHRRFEPAQQQLDHLARLLDARSPTRRLQRARERLALGLKGLRQQLRSKLLAQQQRLQLVDLRWQRHAAPNVLTARNQALQRLQQSLLARTGLHLSQLATRLEIRSSALLALSPQRTLERGYAIVFRRNGSVLKSAEAAIPGEALRIQLADGSVPAYVTR